VEPLLERQERRLLAEPLLGQRSEEQAGGATFVDDDREMMEPADVDVAGCDREAVLRSVLVDERRESVGMRPLDVVEDVGAGHRGDRRRHCRCLRFTQCIC